jgi:hypothetical protein
MGYNGASKALSGLAKLITTPIDITDSIIDFGIRNKSNVV